MCSAPLRYLQRDEQMECALCGKKEFSKTKCEKGHYICNECHTKGMVSIIDICLHEKSKNPVEIIRKLMDAPFCHMHGPEHHVMVGSALLTAYKNAGGEIDLENDLLEMYRRGKNVPGEFADFGEPAGRESARGFFSPLFQNRPRSQRSPGDFPIK